MTVILTKLLPFFLFIFVGYILAKFKILRKQDSEGIIKYIYYVGVPSLLFSLITEQNISFDQLPWLVVLGYFTPLTVIYFVCIFVWNKFTNKYLLRPTASISVFQKQSIGIYSFACVFSNLALLGIPTVQVLFGKEGLKTLVTILSFHGLILLSMLIATLEWSKRNKNKALVSSLASTIKRMILNPIILALLLGFLWNIIGFNITYPFDFLLQSFSVSVPPVSLVGLGAAIYIFGKDTFLKQHYLSIISITTLKVIIVPTLVFIFTNYVLHLPEIQVIVSTFIAGIPTGLNAFILSSKYNADSKVAAGAIYFSTILSAFTLPIILVLLERAF